jgi:ParB/RepB/Spo0J family partition protein
MMVIRRDEHIARLALGSANRGGHLKSGNDAPQLVETVAVSAIDPDPDQPRRHFDPDDLRELADSLRSVGQIQPIILIRDGERFRIHVGERRWRASQIGGLPTIRAIIWSTPLEAQRALIARIVENEQRAPLTINELVEGVAALRATGMKGIEIAAALAKPRSRISELAALAEAPPELRAIIDRIGLALSYQLLGQWRAHRHATVEFLQNMPVAHISRITIATIGQPAADPIDDASSEQVLAAADLPDPGGAGEGATPRARHDAARRREQPTESNSSTVWSALGSDTVGTLLVEHDVHGSGQVAFGLDVPPDHLAVRFADGAPITVHKADICLVRTFVPGPGRD